MKAEAIEMYGSPGCSDAAGRLSDTSEVPLENCQ